VQAELVRRLDDIIEGAGVPFGNCYDTDAVVTMEEVCAAALRRIPPQRCVVVGGRGPPRDDAGIM
jgi:hypothetical protein